MGNVVSFKCGGEIVPKLRVLMPDGTVAVMEGPVEVMDLMMEHPNHMVVHCAPAGSQAIGSRPAMTICRPDQELQPGNSYVMHPIPAPGRKPSKQLSLPKSSMDILSGGYPAKHRGDSDVENQRPKLFRQRSWRLVTEFLQKSQSKVVDSGPGADSNEKLQGQSPRDIDSKNLVEEEEDRGVQLRLNIYMGWRPALESIPELP